MFAICNREFKSLFKSIRSIIIIVAIFGVTLGAAKLISKYQDILTQIGLTESPYATGLTFIILIAGPLFVSALSHNVINDELKSRTIRFIATKTTRDNIILGKFLGTLFFWIACILVSVLLLIPFAKTFYLSEFIQSIIFITYFIGLFILLSIVIPKPAITSFLGIAVSIAFTILGVWSTASDNIFLKIFGYITPYYYFNQDNTSFTYLVIAFPIIFLLVSLITFRKKDL
jgi:ABC-2 type transport system permease protein